MNVGICDTKVRMSDNGVSFLATNCIIVFLGEILCKFCASRYKLQMAYLDQVCAVLNVYCNYYLIDT